MSERPTDEELRRLLTKYGFQSDSSTVLAILDEKDALRKRVVALEAALKQVHAHICAFGSDEDLAVIDAALSDAPQ